MTKRKGLIAVITAATIFVGGFQSTGEVQEVDSAYVSPIGEQK